MYQTIEIQSIYSNIFIINLKQYKYVYTLYSMVKLSSFYSVDANRK